MRIVLAVLGALISTSAFAHTGHGDASGFMHGFMHPFGGLDHVLAMVAVGILAFVAGRRALWTLPLAFMAAMLAGGAMGMSGMSLPLVETGIGASIIVVAGLAALGAPLPLMATAPLIAFFGLFHGFAHGAEMPLDASGLTYAVGFLAATGLLHMSGIAGSTAVAKVVGVNGRLAARVASGAVALAGAGVLSGAI
jgi:urease accessory protein